jgi:hypothetical protein
LTALPQIRKGCESVGTSNRTIFVIAVVAAVAFIYGLAQLFVLRFEEGDVYAPYSSFRSDPIGARAIYEALAQVGDVSVRRNMEEISLLPDGQETTLFIFGANTSEDPEKIIEKLETFAAQGGRIVITFYPKAHIVEDPEDKEKDGEKDKKKDEHEKPPWYSKPVSIADRWGFAFETSRLPKAEKTIGEDRARKLAGPEALPAVLSWHSALFFDKADENWAAIYRRDKHAVIIERRWNKGSIVLCSDSYFLSNEAMRNERHPQLIAWLVGPSATVIFDEVHLGTQEKLGVMSLIRRYRLEGVLLVILIVASLFVWKNSNSLTPKRDSVSGEYLQSGAGKDSAAALVNLLRRSVPPKALLSVCAEEWGRSTKVKSERQTRIQAVIDREQALPARERKPVEAYRTICGILKERD